MILSTNSQLAAYRRSLAQAPVFVPTMGALHAGHASLIERAAALAGDGGGRAVVVSVFVNPTQFNERADFDRYPRPLLVDAEICRRAGATAVYAPTVGDVYPDGAPDPHTPLPPAATDPGLEDRSRPGHFAGVVRVVRRLFELVTPSQAVFGEKDWQQLQVVRQMTLALGMPIEIIPGSTVREPDGLAMSSRNVFLAAADRPKAVAISRALREAAGHRDPTAAERAMSASLSEAGVSPEYAVVRDAQTLGPVVPGRAARALIAARIGTVRLIDNSAW